MEHISKNAWKHFKTVGIDWKKYNFYRVNTLELHTQTATGVVYEQYMICGR